MLVRQYSIASVGGSVGTFGSVGVGSVGVGVGASVEESGTVGSVEGFVVSVGGSVGFVVGFVVVSSSTSLYAYLE